MAKVYDAIVVGSGACGGWAAMELSKAGMKVLMLEAGAHVDPAKDFQHTFLYEMDYRGRGKPGLLRRYSGSERNYRIMLDNEENPYTTSPETVYRWSRSRCLGGRTLHWARATDRMADYEFKAASRDGYGMDWAVTYADMKPYYDEILSGGGRAGPAGFPGGPGSPDSGPGRGTAAEAPGRRALGGSIHECGTARMSANPKEGVLNSFCQTHDIPNLYVFGGNAFLDS